MHQNCLPCALRFHQVTHDRVPWGGDLVPSPPRPAHRLHSPHPIPAFTGLGRPWPW